MEALFHSRNRPFAAAPRTDRYFAAASIENARRTLLRTVDRAEGPAVVIGAVGTGKSLLCRLIAEQFRDTFRVALVAGGRIDSRRSLWQAVLFELRLPFRGMDDGELRLALVGHLTANAPSTQPVLLLVDEAHLLTPRLLDELRILADLVPEGQSSSSGQTAVRLILTGGPALEERFAHPKLENFSQRLCARCYLEPLTREETAEYVRAQLAACNPTAANVFEAAAIDAVYRATDGVPRLVNQVCDHALVLAYSEGAVQVTGLLVDEAWADLQQLPTPWSVQSVATPVRRIDEAHREASGAVEYGAVEFGELDDRDEFAASVPFRKDFVTASANETDSASPTQYDLAGAEADESFSALHLPAFDGAAAFDYAPPAIEPEAEVTVAAEAVDPFGDDFLEEEPVVDRFATLPSTTLPSKAPPAATTILPKPPAAQQPAIAQPKPSPAPVAPAYDDNHFAAYQPAAQQTTKTVAIPQTAFPSPATQPPPPASLPAAPAPLVAEQSNLPWPSGQVAALGASQLGSADDHDANSLSATGQFSDTEGKPTPFDLSYGHAGSDYLQLAPAKSTSAVSLARTAERAAERTPAPSPVAPISPAIPVAASTAVAPAPNPTTRPQQGGDLKHLFTRLRRSGTH